jgi:hypothetical protein
MDKRERFDAAWEELYRAVCALGVGDIDGHERQFALNSMGWVQSYIHDGLMARQAELVKEQEAAVLKAWREGRVTIAD